jgi:23S rRNA-/tRNA-specific pseudouridylate synthase
VCAKQSDDDWDDDGEEIEWGESPDAKPAPTETRRRDQPKRAEPSVLFSDDYFCIVDKPAWLPIRSGPEIEVSLLEKLELPEETVAIGPADDEASGLVTLARTERVREDLSEQIADGRMTSVWLAIVRTTLPAQSGTIDAPLFVPRQPWAKVRIDPERGIAARTEWRLVEAFAGSALIECVPRSGCRHQIRAHLSSVGMPLAVDSTYGGAKDLMLSSFKPGYRESRRGPERPLIARLSLHSARVALRHPRNGDAMEWTISPPRDFRAAANQLAKYGRLSPGRF